MTITSTWGVDQGLHALHHIGGNADAGAAEQTSLVVLCGEGIFDLLLNILDSNQSLEIVVVIHDGEFLFSGFRENSLCLLQGNANLCGNQVLGGHGFLDFLGEIRLEFQIPVGNDTHQFAVFCDGNTGNAEFCHQIVGVLQRMLRREIEGVGNDTVLRTLYLVYLVGLLLDGHVFVNDSDTSLTRHGDRRGAPLPYHRCTHIGCSA